MYVATSRPNYQLSESAQPIAASEDPGYYGQILNIDLPNGRMVRVWDSSLVIHQESYVITEASVPTAPQL